MLSLFLRSGRTRAGVVTVLTASAMVLTACVTNEETGHPDGWEELDIAAVPEIAAMVPPQISERGTITVGTNVPYAPAEFKDSDGEIIGFDIDLARAVAQVMGLELELADQDFSLILPSVSAGTVDFGASSFTDNEERRESYDFVDYLYAGIQWTAQTGHPVDPDDPCGLTVSVQRTTVSETDDINPKSEACVRAGREPITKLAYDSSDGAATALVLGRADAMSSDSPVAAFAVARADGKIETAGELFDASPYGWPVPKESPLGPALAAALQHLIDSGDYARILGFWGIEHGLIETAQINGEPYRP
ncbi:ABC transporter substrate-binding protein [Corynebacterium pygosceleis]|uniref:ABC transporter substrate-binding protein n=1 Tax=Corynebacterium pygosceleis TaxID=2800406 RepID=A0ABT3WV24_9CORY|nr:ABC transporter substrate-binding protein [Corynebacterium pygosceleis]MCK7675522.1 ABC transporter substrate-binding protein [Corynebacterium pygosceleis]MCL0121084.1 ABC transporter substrate-binding protein [Corynebacterium pygosceleis]MCX7444652.1 ABC transporter substrate-binding protein [Corynebacterium pygosceleis]